MDITGEPDWRTECIERLATAVSAYPDLDVKIGTSGTAPFLTASNKSSPLMTETVAVSRRGDPGVYVWSWGERISDTGDPELAAKAIAYVLSSRSSHLGF